MPYQRSDDLWPPLALLSLGLLMPGLVWALVGDLVALYVSPVQLTLVIAVGYGLFAWFVIDRGRIDRTSFFLVSLVWPWPLLFGVLILLLLLNQGEQIAHGPLADVFRAITTDWPGSLFGYGAVFAGTGVAVYGLSRWYRGRTQADDRLPAPSRLIPALVVLLLLLAVIGAGANALVTQSASIERVGPGTRPYQDPALNVTVDGPAADLRVTAIAPGGAQVTTRLSRDEMRGGSGTAAIPLDYDETFTPEELPVRDGGYRVRVTSLAGVTVDTATFDAGDAAAASLSAVSTANGTLPWTAPPIVYSRGAGDTRLGLAVVNEGPFHAEFSFTVRFPADDLVVDRVFLAPGERGGVVIGLSPNTVRAVQETGDGTVRIELYVSATADEPEATVDVAIPEAAAST